MYRLDTRGALASAAAAVLYGSSYVATAIALRSFTPLAVATGRGLLAAVLLAALLALPSAASLRPSRPNAEALLRIGLLGLLGGPIFIVAMNVAVALSGATITAFVAGLYAVLAAALAIPLLGERPERSTVLSLALALLGTALLSDLRTTFDLLGGMAVGLLAALSFALFLVLSRRWSVPYSLTGPGVALAAMGLTAITVGPLLPLLGDRVTTGHMGADALAAVIWLAAGPGALAAVLVVAGMRRLPARRASAFLLLNPPTAALGAWLLLGERLSGLQVAGAMLVLGSIAGASGLISRRSAPGSSPAVSPPRP